jgi:hypothetical protein
MKKLFLIACFLSGLNSIAHAQALDSMDKVSRSRADSSFFSVNAAGDWSLYQAYAKPSDGGSVSLEMILRHSNSVDWKQDQYVGMLRKKSLIPKQEREIPFNRGLDAYHLRIDRQGRCFVKLVNGQLPAADPVIIPFKVNYQK